MVSTAACAGMSWTRSMHGWYYIERTELAPSGLSPKPSGRCKKHDAIFFRLLIVSGGEVLCPCFKREIRW